MNRAIAIVVCAIVVVLLVVFGITYTVRFNEVAVRTTFGKTSTASVVSEPGVHFQYPLFMDRVHKYDTRVQLAETPLVEVPTADGQSVVVKAFLMWRIDNSTPERVETFARSFREEREAGGAIRGLLQTAVKSALSRYTFEDLIGADSRLGAAESAIQQQIATATNDMGIVPVVVGISRVQLPAKTSRAVLDRMQATRQKLAETERTKGNAAAFGITSEANTIVDVLKSFAEQRAAEIRGEAQRKAAEYLREMSEDEQLAIFLVQLDAMRKGLHDNATIVLSDEAAPWHLLNQSNMVGAAPIPQPKKEALGDADRKEDDEPVARKGS